MLSEVPPSLIPLGGRASNATVLGNNSNRTSGRSVKNDEFISLSGGAMTRESAAQPAYRAADSSAIYQPPADERVVHNDREILTEYQDETDYATDDVGGGGLRETSRKHYSPFWNPLSWFQNLDGLGKTIAIYVFVSAVITVALLFQIRYGDPQVSPHAGAVTDVAECSQIGMQILQDGGSAVDAAIGAMTCVEVMNFQSTGIGGGGFMLVYNHKSREGKVFDFRETAPAQFRPEMMPANSSPTADKSDVLMVGVPGLLKGFDVAHKIYGRLPWHEVFQPAINLARHGFDVTPVLAHAAREQLINRFLNDPLRRLVHANFDENRDFVDAGQRIKRENLSYTLERVANMGANEFYEGNLASKLVADVVAMGGILSLEDLRNYHVIVREPILANISDYTVMTSPPPASGPALIFGLKILEKFTKSAEHVAKDHHLALDNTDAWQHIIETLKFMFIQQSRLGDVSGTVSTSDAVNRTRDDMLSAATIDRVFQAINNTNKLADAAAYFKTIGIDSHEKFTPLTDAGTSGGVFVDNDELYVSVITSLNDQFGAGLLSENLGILLNNQLRDFADDSAESSSPNTNNLPRPNKRPLSSMTPTVFFHPTKSCFKRGAVAGSNGTRILSGMLEVLTRVLLFDEDLLDAIEAPRVHVEKNPDGKVFVEKGVPQNILDELVKRGQNLDVLPDKKQSAINAIIKWNDTLIGYGDSRKDGADAVYK